MTLSPDPVVRDLQIMAPAVRYPRWIYTQFRGVLGRRVLECGAGIGNFTRFLTDREVVLAVDSYGPCVEQLKVRFADQPNIVPLQLDISSPDLLALESYHLDTIVCVNVLEHVADDQGTLTRLHEILQPGGYLAVLVPAFQFLYGSIDEVIGHYRRYNTRELREKLGKAQFHLLDLFYMNCVAPAAWFLNNRILNRREESSAQVLIFDRWVVPWLSRFERVIRPPFGLSAIAIARKDGPR